MNYHKKVLPNGLRLLTIPMPSFESATVMVMVGAGSRYENRLNSGISHFLEHMAFKGTQKRPSAMSIASLIDGIGGEFNAFTGKESTGYYIKAENSHLSLMMDVLSDMLKHMLLDEKEIEKEKGVIFEELNLYEDTPSRKIGDIFEQLLYGDTPLGWDIGGEKKIIKKITRQDFLKYMKSLYSADNMTVVVAGGVDVDKVEKMAVDYFGKMDTFKTIPFEKIVEKQEKPALFVKKKRSEQAHLAIGFRTVGDGDPDRYPLAVLAAVLGGGMSSRLFEEVREKRGLAYYVRTHADHYMDCGSLATFAGVDPKRAEEAVQVIVEEYKKVKEGKAPITEEEIKKAKEYLKGHFVLELEDSRSVASHYATEEMLEEEIENPDQVLKKIDSVTKAQIDAVIKKYMVKDTLNLAIIGNFKDGQPFQNLLSL